MEVSNYLVSWVISPTYGTYNLPENRGYNLLILSTMDIQVANILANISWHVFPISIFYMASFGWIDFLSDDAVSCFFLRIYVTRHRIKITLKI